MNRFAEQSEQRKLWRLEQVARTALEEYGLTDSRLHFIGQSFNAVYRVVAADGQQYVLRVHRFNVYDALEMRSEFLWLDHLRQCDDLMVSEPVSNRHGDFVTELAVRDVPGSHYCTMLRWHPGTPLEDPPSNYQCYMAGELLAKLHRCSQQFVPSADFKRPWLGSGYALECLARIQANAPTALLSSKAIKVVEAIADHVDAVMKDIGTGADDFGIIHGDLHGGNLLFHDGTVRAIDFDGCGWGHYLYDIAIMTHHVPPASASRMLMGYRRHRDLDERERMHLQAFQALRVLDQLAYQLPNVAAAAQTLTRLQSYELLKSKLSGGRPARFKCAN